MKEEITLEERKEEGEEENYRDMEEDREGTGRRRGGQGWQQRGLMKDNILGEDKKGG